MGVNSADAPQWFLSSFVRSARGAGATAPDDALRDGPTAVTLAERACERTRQAVPMFLDTLAAAYAEAGRFADAVTTQERAVELAPADGRAAEPGSHDTRWACILRLLSKMQARGRKDGGSEGKRFDNY